MRAIVAGILVLAFLAGCVDGSATKATGKSPAGPGFDATTGAIEGWIVSEELLPIPGANVSVVGTARFNLTDAAGRFFIGGLSPGEYEVNVTAIGYHGRSFRAIVFEESVNPVPTFVLQSKPSDFPYYEVIIKKGFWYCGLQYFAAGLYCATLTIANQTGPVLNVNIFLVNFASGWNETVFEQVWNRNAGVTTSGRAYTYIATWNQTTKTWDGPPRETVKGASPLVARFYPGFQGYQWLNTVGVRPKPLPFPPNVERVQYSAFLLGLLTNETQGVYPEQPGAPNQGMGATFQTPFQIYSAQFYYARGPEHYTSLPDA